MSDIALPGLDPAPPLPPARRRAASVTLRTGEQRAESVGDLMDPANKSLADALRIAYRLLLLLIVVMAVMFVFSSTQTVQTSEIGVRTTLGRIDRDNLDPGLRFSWPEPFGRIIKISRTNEHADLTREFFPSLASSEELLLSEKGVQGLAEGGRDVLDPDSDGALLTADGSLVHARWQITYVRARGAQSLRAISSDADAATQDFTEKRLVASVCRRAVVHAAAGMTIDEILSGQKDPSRTTPFRPIGEVAKSVAQSQLNAMEVGIDLQNFDMKTPMPPRHVAKSFSSVQTAQAAAKQNREKAEGDAQNRIIKAAGEGAPVLLALIDRYDAALAGDPGGAPAVLQTIQDYMRRKPITIDGKPVTRVVSGDVSTIISQSEQDATGVAARARSEATAFKAKLDAFKASPQVFLNHEWSNAIKAVMGRSSVQSMLLPPGLERLMVQINRDPWLATKDEEVRAQRDVERNLREMQDKRRRELHNKKFDGTSFEGA